MDWIDGERPMLDDPPDTWGNANEKIDKETHTQASQCQRQYLVFEYSMQCIWFFTWQHREDRSV